ncbi:hypothetical protein ACTWP5_14435 [Streptomyces sp. 4N509B]|uniref:hypothetical protein n=1 Tax=Streptomyces sp. 4N509B TaxID=3457413 RepID=UPI003FCF9A24
MSAVASPAPHALSAPPVSPVSPVTPTLLPGLPDAAGDTGDTGVDRPDSAPVRRRPARAARRSPSSDDSRRLAVSAVQRALDRRDNGGAFGH